MSRSVKTSQVLGLVVALLAAGTLLAGGNAPQQAPGQGKAEEAVKALRAELEELRAALKLSQEKLLKQAQEVARLRKRAAAAEANARTFKDQADKLLKQLAESEKENARLRAGDGPGVKPGKGQGKSNPPKDFVKGKVLKIDATDKTLVTVSLGRDMGVNAGHTLEVYRLKPNPLYLGRILILDTQNQTAVGRLMKRPGAPPPALEVGDEVASQLK
jgi:hypothetical protein